MTREQIEQAAIEYASDHFKSGRFGIFATAEAGFVAGAQSRQAEIDQLTSDVERYKNDVAEAVERERTARKIIEDKRVENKELAEALDAMLIAAAQGDGWEGATYNAQQILKKHER